MAIPDVIGRLETFAGPIGAAAVRGAIILLVALVATQLLRRHSAAMRHAIWSGAVAAQLVVLVLGIWGPRWRVATPPAVADAVAPVIAIPNAGGSHAVSSVRSEVPTFDVGVRRSNATSSSMTIPAGVSATSAAPPPVPAPELTGRALLLLLWLGGALFVVLRLAAGTVIVAMLARRGARVDDGHWLSLAQKLATTLGIDRPLILMRGSTVAVPITWGIVYPVVLLPKDADAWTEERRRFVLVHEMAHVKRFDALTQLVGQIALAIFWFNPLIWIANRRMQLEREHACDDYVLRHGTAPSQYAEELLEMVRSLGTPGHASAQPAFAALAMARRSEFEGRMLSILDPVLDRHPLSRGGTMIGVLASLLVVVPLAAVQPYRAEAREAIAPAPKAAVPTDADHLPESFKLSFHDAPVQQQSTTHPSDTSVQVLAPFTSAAKALAAGQASLSRQASKFVTQISTAQSCSSAQLGRTGSTTHIHSDSDDGMGVVSYLSTSDSRCAQASIVGKLTFNAGETDVTDMSSSAHALFRERTAADDRELTLYRTDSGIVHAYRHNGSDTAYDDDARRWFARFLPTVLQEVSLNVGPRVARWRAEGGVSRVLTEIATIQSSNAKRMHYDALLDGGHLTSEETDRIVQQASHDLTSSSDLSAILQKVAPGLRHLGGSARLLGAAIVAIPSSSDRTSVLRTYGETDNREVLLAVMRVAKTIPSSSDLSALLEELAPRYLSGNDAELRTAFFDAANVIPSSTDLSAVLDVAIGYVNRSEAHARAVLESASRLASSTDKADVLIRFVDAGGLRTPALRDQFMSVASGIASSTDMRRVLEAATKH
jgi:beta-lactamase regulating signal transducer with metallopeptidase domain